MTATTFPTTNSNQFPRRLAAAAMAAIALAGGVTAGVMIADDDSDTVNRAPAIVQPSPVDKDAVRLQNSRSLPAAPAVDKDVARLQNLASIDSPRTGPSAGGTTQLRYGVS